MKIITISGLARHGKDESANIIKGYFEQRNKKCLIIKNADYLKFVCKEYFGWNGEKDEAGRTMLQIYGTEKARDNHKDVWVDVIIAFLKTFGNMYDYVLISDVRYENEISKLIDSGFDVRSLWVHRKNFDNGLTPEQKAHRSETSLLDYKFDRVISVESKIYLLKDALESWLKEWVK